MLCWLEQNVLMQRSVAQMDEVDQFGQQTNKNMLSLQNFAIEGNICNGFFFFKQPSLASHLTLTHAETRVQMDRDDVKMTEWMALVSRRQQRDAA